MPISKSICSKFTLSFSKLCRFTVTNYIFLFTTPHLFNINQMVACNSKAPQQNAPALHANIWLGWKCLTAKNTLAYHLIKWKVYIGQAPWREVTLLGIVSIGSAWYRCNDIVHNDTQTNGPIPTLSITFKLFLVLLYFVSLFRVKTHWVLLCWVALC